MEHAFQIPELRVGQMFGGDLEVEDGRGTGGMMGQA